MKLNLIKKSSGYTLVEILVVMAILATLAGISYPIMMRFAEDGRKADAKSTMKNLADAVHLFKTDTGMYPGLATTTPTADAVEDTSVITSKFIQALVGETGTNNFEEKSYFEAKTATDSKNGLTATNQLLDPWGNGYIVCVDYDLDGEIDMDAASFLDADCIFNTQGVINEEVIPLCKGKTGAWEIGNSFWNRSGDYN